MYRYRINTRLQWNQVYSGGALREIRGCRPSTVKRHKREETDIELFRGYETIQKLVNGLREGIRRSWTPVADMYGLNKNMVKKLIIDLRKPTEPPPFNYLSVTQPLVTRTTLWTYFMSRRKENVFSQNHYSIVPLVITPRTLFFSYIKGSLFR